MDRFLYDNSFRFERVNVFLCMLIIVHLANDQISAEIILLFMHRPQFSSISINLPVSRTLFIKLFLLTALL